MVDIIAVCVRPGPDSELRRRYGAQYWCAVEATDRGRRRYMGVGRNRRAALRDARRTRVGAHA